MSLTGVLFILIALAADCFVTAWHSSALHQKLREPFIFKLPFFFAAGRSAFIMLGIFTGSYLAGFVDEFSDIFGISLLVVLGLKILIESFKFVPEEKVILIENNKTLTILTVAGSINTLFAGIGFGMIGVNFSVPFIATLIIVFVLSFAGMIFGKKKGLKPEIRFVGLFAGIIILVLTIRLIIPYFI